MRYLPNILLVLSLPAGLLGYALGVFLVRTLAPSLANSIVVLFVALFVAGLCMVPFVIPFIDRKAKQDLAAYRASRRQPTMRGSPGRSRPPPTRRCRRSRPEARPSSFPSAWRSSASWVSCLLVHRRVLPLIWGVPGHHAPPGRACVRNARRYDDRVPVGDPRSSGSRGGTSRAQAPGCDPRRARAGHLRCRLHGAPRCRSCHRRSAWTRRRPRRHGRCRGLRGAQAGSGSRRPAENYTLASCTSSRARCRWTRRSPRAVMAIPEVSQPARASATSRSGSMTATWRPARRDLAAWGYPLSGPVDATWHLDVTGPQAPRSRSTRSSSGCSGSRTSS